MLIITEAREDHGVEWYEEGDKGEGLGADCRLVLLTYGRCVYWVNNTKYIMEKGELLLLPAGQVFYGKSIPTVFHTKLSIRFVPGTASGELSLLQRSTPLHLRLGCYDKVLERLKELLIQWQERPSYYELMAGALLAEALVMVSQELDRGPITSSKHRCVERMKHYIQQHYRERVSKEQLGDAIQRTPNYAATLFREVTGQTISAYTHSQRIKTAIYLLTESQLTVSEISEYVGYSDVSYFYRIFKRLTGHSPSDYFDERSPIV